MTAAECEIVADAACHLKAIAARMVARENVSEIAYVVGMLATLPIEPEPPTCSLFACPNQFPWEPKHSARV